MKTATQTPGITYLNRFLAGTLFGGQLVWSVAVLPTYKRLTPDEYVKAHTLLTWYGDALMPALGLSTTLTGYLRYRKTGEINALVGTMALAAASIAAARNLRINDRMRELRADSDAAGNDRAAHDAALSDPAAAHPAAAHPTAGKPAAAKPAGPVAVAGHLERERKLWAAQHLIRSTGGFVADVAFQGPSGRSLTLGRPAGGRSVGWLDAVAVAVAIRSGREIVGHLTMMRGRGKNKTMATALGIRAAEPQHAPTPTPEPVKPELEFELAI